MAGYSGTPLVRKLGIKPGEQIVAINAPEHYAELLEDLPKGASVVSRLRPNAKFVHLFVTGREELDERLSALRDGLDDAGMLWVSWPKKASRVPTDITENVIREVALPLGFVDVKVCAIDDVWSGLKLMIRREARKK
jgi:hypothetical protein